MCLSIPGKVLEISFEKGVKFGKVDFGGIQKRVCLQVLSDVKVGDYALVHVGFAITKVDAEEAEKTFKLVEEMGLVEAELMAAEEI